MTLMDTNLWPFIGKFVIVFLDETLIFSCSAYEHLDHLRQVFGVLREHKLFPKESKCEFFQSEIHYLGHIISDEGIRMDPEKVEAILRWLHPKSMQELQMFLG